MQNELDSSIKPVEEKELKKKKLPRWLKIVLISVTSVISLLFLIVILLITVFEDEMVQYALSYFSKNIKTKSAVESAELSLWTNFPSASIQFNNVYIIENSERQDTLIKAEKMYASFDVIDLFSGKYEFEDFGIEDGRCSFTVDKSGKENWDVWLSDSVIDNEGEKYAVAIENILTDKISFSYVNDSSKQNIQLSIQELVAEGAFTQDNFELSIDGKLKTKKIELNEQSFLKNKQFDLESSFEVDMKKSNLVFNKTNVTVEETPLVFAGNLSFGRNPEISCVIDPTEMNFVNIIDLLPEEIGAQFQAYEPSGIALFDLSMNGPFDNLNVKTNIQIKEASLKEINSGVELDNIEFTGAYNLSNGQDSIEIKSLAAKLGDGLVSLNGKILPSNEPFVNLKLETSSNLNDVKNFLSWDSLTTCNGSMKLQAEIVGKIAFDSVDSSFIWSNVNLAGTAEISDAEFQWYGTSQHLTEINGVLKLEGQNALVDNFNFLLNQTKISISGGLNNLIPYLTTDGEILEVNSLIYIPEFKLENWISSEEEARSVGMPNDIRLILHSKIDAFSYQSFHAEKIQGIIEAYQGTYSLSPLTMSIAGGEMHTDVLLSPKNDNGISMEATAVLENISIDEVFVLFNDFGQTSLTHSNIKGKATAEIDFRGDYTSAFDLIKESVVADILIQIENGELIAVQSLQYITDYIKGNKWIAPFINEQEFSQKLKHVRFENLENSIHIENQIIEIPLMNIESNALDITLEGTHSFNNYLDYKFGFDLKDVLLSNDGSSGRQIYIFMKGPWENLEYGLDKDALKADRIEQRNIKKEKLKEKFKSKIRLPILDRNKEGDLNSNEPSSLAEKQKISERFDQIQNNIKPILKNDSKMTEEEKKKVENSGKGKQVPKWLQEKNQFEEEE